MIESGGDLYKDEYTRKTLTLALLLRYLIHKEVTQLPKAAHARGTWGIYPGKFEV